MGFHGPWGAGLGLQGLRFRRQGGRVEGVKMLRSILSVLQQ